jgi:hypothetical protein
MHLWSKQLPQLHVHKVNHTCMHTHSHSLIDMCIKLTQVLCVCIEGRIDLCTYVCVCVYIYIYVYTHHAHTIYSYSTTGKCAWIHKHTNMHEHTRTHMNTHTYTCTHDYRNVYIHASRTHTHTHTHTLMMLIQHSALHPAPSRCIFRWLSASWITCRNLLGVLHQIMY